MLSGGEQSKVKEGEREDSKISKNSVVDSDGEDSKVSKNSVVDSDGEDSKVSKNSNSVVDSDGEGSKVQDSKISESKSTSTINPLQKLNTILYSLNNDIDDIESVMNTDIDEETKKFYKIIQGRIEKLRIRSNILRFKYSDYKKYYDGTNIGIICISACLTLVESYKNILDIKNESETVQNIFAIIPITLSSLIGLSASVLKFKKYQHKMESIMKCIEHCATISLSLKNILDQINLCGNDPKFFNKIRNTYLKDLNPSYLKCDREICMNLRYNDLVKHMETFQNLNLQYQRSNSLYLYQKKRIQMLEKLKETNIKDDVEEEQEYGSCWLCWACCRFCHHREYKTSPTNMA